MTSGTINLDPAKCAERVALDRADIEKLRAIADWAQEQAEEAWRAVHMRESQQREMLRLFAENGWTPDDDGQQS